MTNNKQIARNTMFLYFRMFLIMGVSLYTSRVILSTLGIENFGIYNVVGGIVTMFTFLSGCLGAATSRYITYELGRKDYNRLNEVFNVALVVHIVIALLIVILAETVGLWFFYEKMSIPENRVNAAFWVYQISIVTTIFALTNVPYDADVIARENLKIYAYIGMFETILKLIVVYLLYVSPFDKLVFYAVLLFCIQLSKMLFTRLYCIRHYQESRFKFCRDILLYKEIFTYAGSDLIGNVSGMAQGQGVNLLLNVYFGPIVNAARAVAYQVQGAVTQFSNNFMTAVRPQIIKSYAEGNIKDMWTLVIRSSIFSYYLMWMICLPIILEAETILKIWLGKYPEHTVNFLILILTLCLIQTVKTPRSTIFHATGKVFWSNVTVGIVLCLAFPLAYILLESGGKPESVFWACNISMAISEIVSVIVLKHFVDFSALKYFVSVHGRCLVVSIVSFLVCYSLYNRFLEQSFIRLISTMVLTSITIVITVFIIGMDNEMRDKFFSIIQKKLLKHE